MCQGTAFQDYARQNPILPNKKGIWSRGKLELRLFVWTGPPTKVSCCSTVRGCAVMTCEIISTHMNTKSGSSSCMHFCGMWLLWGCIVSETTGHSKAELSGADAYANQVTIERAVPLWVESRKVAVDPLYSTRPRSVGLTSGSR